MIPTKMDNSTETGTKLTLEFLLTFPFSKTSFSKGILNLPPSQFSWKRFYSKCYQISIPVICEIFAIYSSAEDEKEQITKQRSGGNVI